MSRPFPILTDAEIRDVHFDLNQLVELPTDATSGDNPDWQVVERGSDEHIAFLEQVLRDLQATLAELKAERATRTR